MKSTGFRILGPVQAWSGGKQVDLGPKGHRLVLGVLLMEVDRYVTLDRLIGLLWGPEPPTSARGIIHSRISVLRRALRTSGELGRQVSVERAAGGYRLICDPRLVDASRFADLVSQADSAETDERRRDLLRESLALWSGPALEGSSGFGGTRLGAALESARLTAMEALYDVELRRGRHTGVAEDLMRTLAQHPTHEKFVEQCMLALYRSGRVRDSLLIYDRYRGQLVDELGLDPGRSIQDLHRRILTSDNKLHHRRMPTGSTTPPPAQLPAATDGFFGRHDELKVLDRALYQAVHGGLSRVIAVVGPAGSGKTSLAVHWSHLNRARFTDGQLFVDLRDYGGDLPLTPEVVLERFLRALEVPVDSIPKDLDDRAATFRSMLAQRRLLIVLDNASSATQVRPLLPGSGSSLTIVTSRSRLDGLVATHGTTRLELGPLSQADALTLIERSCGLTDRVLATLLADLCERLPLALRIVAARLMSPSQDAITLLSDLSNERQRLAELDIDDEISIRSALDGSSKALSPQLHRTFRLLALHPGPRVSIAACSALAGIDADMAREHLQFLASINLIKADSDDYFVFHDLVKLYAGELSLKHDTQESREEAQDQILTWYRDTANAADRVLRPSERPNFPLPGTAGFETEADALAWLDAESHTLIAAAVCAGPSHPQLAWQIAASMYGWLTRRGQRSQWIELYERAAAWAVRAGDLAGQAMIIARLAIPHGMLNNTEQAASACVAAHDIRMKLGDRIGAATALLNLGAVYINAARLDDALVELKKAMELGLDLPDNRHLMAIINSNIAEAQRLAGRPELSIESFAKAIAGGEGYLPDRDMAQLLIGSASAHKDIGDLQAATRDCERGYELARRAGDRALVAEAHAELGRIHLCKMEYQTASSYLQSALPVMEELGHRSVAELRTLLVEADQHR